MYYLSLSFIACISTELDSHIIGIMYHTELYEQILTRKRACEQLQKFGEHEQASTRLNFASKSSKGKILRAVKNFNGPFITPNTDKKASMRATAKIWGARASEHSFKFCEQIEQGKNFASSFKKF